MFQREIKTSYSYGSFFAQQVMVVFVLSIFGALMTWLFSPFSAFALVAPLLIGGVAGYLIEILFPGATIVGKWVWILPTVLLSWNTYDWLSADVPLREALANSFWPSPDSGERGLGSLLTIPAIVSWGYVGGLSHVSRQRTRKVSD